MNTPLRAAAFSLSSTTMQAGMPAVATMPEDCAGGREERLGGFDDLKGLALRFGLRVVRCGESLDLLDVEHGVTLHELDLALHLFALVVGLRLGHAIGKDHEGPLLALAHMRFEVPGLPEGHPERGAVALGHRRTPQQQDIDATVRRPVVTAGYSNSAFRTASLPRLQPGTNARFQVGDDAIGHAGVNVAAGGSRIAHDVISFQGSVAVHMHMHRCLSARSGVAKRQGRGAGRGITPILFT